MKITKTENTILTVLFNNCGNYVTGEQLAHSVSVTNRTIRTYIKQINQFLSNCDVAIESRKGYGYRLKNQASIEAIKRIIDPSNIVESSSDQFRKLAVKLILSEESASSYDLEEEFYLSYAQIESCITEANNLSIKYNGHRCIHRKNNMYYCSLSEATTRNLVTLFIDNRSLNPYSYVENSYDYFCVDLFQELAGNVARLLNERNLIISDYDMYHFTIFLYICSLRYENPIDYTCKDNEDGITVSLKQSISDIVYHTFDIQLSDNEMKYICSNLTLIMMNRSFLSGENTKYFTADIPDRYYSLVYSLFNDIKDKYDIDFYRDEELTHDLVYHIFNINRTSEPNDSTDIPSDFLLDFRSQNPFAYELSSYITRHYELLFHEKIDETQLSYIAIHLASSIQQKAANENHDANTINIVVVDNLPNSLAILLNSKLEHSFGISCNVYGPYPFYKMHEIRQKFKRIDSVLVTTSLSVHLPDVDMPIVTVSPGLFDSDIANINQIINHIRVLRIEHGLPHSFSDYFSNDMTFFDVELSSRFEAIMFLSRQLVEGKYVENGFYKDILEREAMSSTLFRNSFALPHPISSARVKKTVIVFLRPKEPILWGSDKAQLIFLLVPCQEDQKDISMLLSIFSNVINSTVKRDQLINCKNYQELISIINK